MLDLAETAFPLMQEQLSAWNARWRALLLHANFVHCQHEGNVCHFPSITLLTSNIAHRRRDQHKPGAIFEDLETASKRHVELPHQKALAMLKRKAQAKLAAQSKQQLPLQLPSNPAGGAAGNQHSIVPLPQGAAQRRGNFMDVEAGGGASGSDDSDDREHR